MSRSTPLPRFEVLPPGHPDNDFADCILDPGKDARGAPPPFGGVCWDAGLNFALAVGRAHICCGEEPVALVRVMPLQAYFGDSVGECSEFEFALVGLEEVLSPAWSRLPWSRAEVGEPFYLFLWAGDPRSPLSSDPEINAEVACAWADLARAYREGERTLSYFDGARTPKLDS